MPTSPCSYATTAITLVGASAVVAALMAVPLPELRVQSTVVVPTASYETELTASTSILPPLSPDFVERSLTALGNSAKAVQTYVDEAPAYYGTLAAYVVEHPEQAAEVMSLVVYDLVNIYDRQSLLHSVTGPIIHQALWPNSSGGVPTSVKNLLTVSDLATFASLYYTLPDPTGVALATGLRVPVTPLNDTNPSSPVNDPTSPFYQPHFPPSPFPRTDSHPEPTTLVDDRVEDQGVEGGTDGQYDPRDGVDPLAGVTVEGGEEGGTVVNKPDHSRQGVWRASPNFSTVKLPIPGGAPGDSKTATEPGVKLRTAMTNLPERINATMTKIAHGVESALSGHKEEAPGPAAESTPAE